MNQPLESSTALLADDALPFPPDDLWSDEPPLESDLHRAQIDLLIRLIQWVFREGGPAGRSDVYAAGNLTVYYSPNQKKSEFFRGPDVFVVLGTENYPRRSWTVWHEGGKYPNVIVELLSDSTADVDRTEKKEIYQSVWRVPNYFWFDPYTLELQGFSLVQGRYQPIQPNPQGWLWSQELGYYLGVDGRTLRLFSGNGQRLPLEEEEERERAIQAQQQAAQAQELLQKERQEKEELLAKLQNLSPEQRRSLGLD